ncbi:MAG: hypothetical protein HY667_01100 [Chloroflexi bacterium]|nr:hypothetical protein [Chloroflexota bacterium]
MRKPFSYYLVVLVMTIGLLLAACARPVPSPTSAPAPVVTTAPTATPKASPTPTAAPAETPQYGGTLKIQTSDVPFQGFLPAIMTTTWPYSVTAAYESLMWRDGKGQFQPWLATDWKLSPDMKSLTLTLRKGVRFHDGTDFNAAAAKWNIEKRKALKLTDYTEVTSVDIIDDYTVRLNLSEYRVTTFVPLASAANSTGGYMYSPTAAQRMGIDWATWNPVGTGPFKFVRYEQGLRYITERFDGYWQKGKPYLDKVEEDFIADSLTASLAFQKGDVHFITRVDAKTLTDLRAKGFKALPVLTDDVQTLVPDSANPTSPFANKKVRLAMEYAIDREGIVGALGFGLYEASYEAASTNGYAYVPELEKRRYDTAKAKQLLSEAGYPNGFKTTVYAMTSSPREVIVAVVTNLKEVGINATLEPVATGRYVQLYREGWSGLVYQVLWDQPDWLFRLDGRYEPASNVSVLKPPDFVKLMGQALVSPDFPTQKQRAQQLVKMMYDEVMITPLYAWGYGTMYRDTVGNPESIQSRSAKDYGLANAWLRK